MKALEVHSTVFRCCVCKLLLTSVVSILSNFMHFAGTRVDDSWFEQVRITIFGPGIARGHFKLRNVRIKAGHAAGHISLASFYSHRPSLPLYTVHQHADLC